MHASRYETTTKNLHRPLPCYCSKSIISAALIVTLPLLEAYDHAAQITSNRQPATNPEMSIPKQQGILRRLPQDGMRNTVNNTGIH